MSLPSCKLQNMKHAISQSWQTHTCRDIEELLDIFDRQDMFERQKQRVKDRKTKRRKVHASN